MNRNGRPISTDSPAHDPIVLGLKAATIVLAVIALLMLGQMIRRDQAMADLHCPAPDHPVWASILNHGRGEWICGESVTFGVTAR